MRKLNSSGVPANSRESPKHRPSRRDFLKAGIGGVAALTAATCAARLRESGPKNEVFDAVRSFPENVDGAGMIQKYPMPGSKKGLVCIMYPIPDLYLRATGTKFSEDRRAIVSHLDGSTARILRDVRQQRPNMNIHTLYVEGIPVSANMEPVVQNARETATTIEQLRAESSTTLSLIRRQQIEQALHELEESSDFRSLVDLLGEDTLRLILHGDLQLKGIEDTQLLHELTMVRQQLFTATGAERSAALAHYAQLQQTRLDGIVDTLAKLDDRFPAVIVGEDFMNIKNSLGDVLNQHNRVHPDNSMSLVAISCASPLRGVSIARG